MSEEPTQEVLTPNHLLYGRKLNVESDYDKNISGHQTNVTQQAAKLNNI